MSTKKEGFDFWKNTLKGSQFVVAPMVDQSELAWRMLSRRYAAELCYTPMFHAALFIRDPIYRKDMFQTCAGDRPLIVQFCANDPETFVQAALLVETECDAVDLNLGCPQGIAKRGHYGAFLQDEWELVAKMVRLAHEKLSVPITCKIRVFEDVQKTIDYAKMLEAAGCQLLTVHGRTRDQKREQTGLANWEHIKAVRESVNIPVFANGNIRHLKDVMQCLEDTGCNGIMTAEGNLTNPALFSGQDPLVWDIAKEYLELAYKHNAALSAVRGHLFKLWHHSLSRHTDLRSKMGEAKSLDQVKKCSEELERRVKEDMATNSSPNTDYGLPYWRCQPYIRPSRADNVRKRPLEENESTPQNNELEAERQTNRQRKRALKRKKIQSKGEIKWILCSATSCENPTGQKCVNSFCRDCCRAKSYAETIDCPTHRLWFNKKSLPRKAAEVEDDTDKCNGHTEGPLSIETQPTSRIIDAS